MFLKSKDIWKDTANTEPDLEELKNRRYHTIDYLTMIKIKKEILEDNLIGMHPNVQKERTIQKYNKIITETQKELNSINEKIAEKTEIER